MSRSLIALPGRRGWTVSLVAILLGALATVALALASTDSFDRTNGHAVELGLPLTWITQDQSASDPPPHARVGLSSPWEDPTHVRAAAALADTAILAVPLALLAAAALRRRRSQRR